MATRPRIFKVLKKRMQGEDIRDWQQNVVDKFASMNIGAPLKVDGIYGSQTHTVSCKLVEAMGLNPAVIKRHGFTIGLRRRLNATAEKGKSVHNPKVDAFRDRLRKAWGLPKPKPKVSKPVNTITGDSWGWHPGVHDGIDVICLPDAPLLAMCKARVIDVRSGGWWGNNPTGNVSAGDGIIQLEVLEDVGPFRKGDHIGYGHAEKAKVKVGQIVRAGQVLGRAGFANAWHIHLMLNDGSQGSRGVGNKDPRAILEWTKNHS